MNRSEIDYKAGKGNKLHEDSDLDENNLKKFRTQKCKKDKCHKKACMYAHNEKELRKIGDPLTSTEIEEAKLA